MSLLSEESFKPEGLHGQAQQTSQMGPGRQMTQELDPLQSSASLLIKFMELHTTLGKTGRGNPESMENVLLTSRWNGNLT